MNRAPGGGEGRIVYTPIGVIHSEHVKPEETPIQPAYAAGCRGTAEVFPAFAEGLEGIEGFSHIFLVYHLHEARTVRLTVKPFLVEEPRGVFATRHPARPNPIGMSVVRLVRREGTMLVLDDLDVLDGTPLLDIKPFVPRFDRHEGARGGWTETVDEAEAQRRGTRARAGDTPGST